MRGLRRVMLLLGVGCLPLVAGCGGGSVAHTAAFRDPGAISLFTIHPTLERDGNPVPTVGTYPDGTASLIHYLVCRPPAGTSRCAAVRLIHGVPLPGPEPAGTLFRVTARYHHHAYASSSRWRGAVREVGAPALSGGARVGSTVTAIPARWTGGWATDADQMAIEACRSRAGTGCVMVTGVWLECGQLGCGIQGGVMGDQSDDRTARVGYALSGFYLFALDDRSDPGVNGLVGFSSPAALPVWHTSPTLVRSPAYGPVSGPPGPRVRILPGARVNGKHVVVAMVRCSVSCHVWVTVTRSSKHVASGERVSWAANKVIKGNAALGVWGSVPRGRMGVQLNVGDGPYVRGMTRVP